MRAWLTVGAFVLALGALGGVERAGAAPHYGKTWRAAPAWTATVPPYGGVRAIPASVCPFGISDLAATSGRREYPAPRVDTLAFAGPRLIVNGSPRALRAFVWCG